MISVCVQHHPSRKDLLWRTALADPEIVADPNPDGIPTAWRTYLACLETTPAEATHRVVLQDDVELCGGFLPALRLAIAARPDSMIALFVPTALRQGSKRLLEACTRDEAWARIDTHETWTPVVALVWPSRLIEDFTSWARASFPPDRKRYADDAIVGSFMTMRREPVWATVPSLVEHPDDVATILHKHLPRVGRHATCFAGERAALIDWSVGA